MVLSHVSGGAFFEVYEREEVQEEGGRFSKRPPSSCVILL